MAERDASGTVFELGGPAAAPVVVLIHGLGLNRHLWRWHLPALAERYRVLAYDLYGHGDSAPPPATPSLSLFAEQLAALLDAAGVAECAVVGFSLGGMINRRFVMDRPGRALALGILNSPHEREPEAQRLVEQRAADSAAGGPAATIESTLERWFTAGFRASRPEVVAEVRDWVLANEPGAYAACRRVLASGVLELIRPAPPIRLPTLVMTCAHDSGSTPAMTHAIAAEIEGAEALVVPGLQHLGLIEQPARFTVPLLRFLDRTLARAGDR